MKVLITGGAGFIGTRLAAKLAARGDEITVLDCLTEQVHGPAAEFPSLLRNLESCTCIRGDVCDRDLVRRLLADTELLVHLAAETGTGQSMYEILRYQRTNVQGTATLVDVIVNDRPKSMKKVVIASSRAVYGEGSYSCDTHGTIHPGGRTASRMAAGRFEPVCPLCGVEVTPIATPEEAPFAPLSFYGLTKQIQEQMFLMFAQALNMDAVALRYQNVYGPGQSLSNPYTGLLAVFAGCVARGDALNVFEDGRESRDFVFIDDVVEATAACASPGVTGVHVVNVGSGVRTSIMEVAELVSSYFGGSALIKVTGDFRLGDIRHNVADTRKLTALTGISPRWGFADGLRRFLDWARGSTAAAGDVERSLEELRQRGMLGGGRSC